MKKLLTATIVATLITGSVMAQNVSEDQIKQETTISSQGSEGGAAVFAFMIITILMSVLGGGSTPAPKV